MGPIPFFYILLKKLGENYRWHSAKQLALIDIEKSESEKAIHELEKGYRKLSQPKHILDRENLTMSQIPPERFAPIIQRLTFNDTSLVIINLFEREKCY